MGVCAAHLSLNQQVLMIIIVLSLPTVSVYIPSQSCKNTPVNLRLHYYNTLFPEITVELTLHIWLQFIYFYLHNVHAQMQVLNF